MIINTGRKQYKIVRDVFLGEVNDVYICQELNTQIIEYKTVWLIKNREVAKKLLQEFDVRKKSQSQIYDECFMQKDNMCFAFPYYQERPLEKFYLSTVKSGNCSREQIWMDLIVQCMTCVLPDTFLQMIFLQNQIQISQDGAIHFNYSLDLSQYAEQTNEQISAVMCAKKIIALMQMEQNPADEALRLLERKLERAKYTQYIQLYKDMKLLTAQKEKNNIGVSIHKWYRDKKDSIYLIIARVSAILIVIVAIMFIIRFAFGDFALYRIFSGPIKQIGTESLLQ